MTIYERLRNAIARFGLPSAPQNYTGPADAYCVYDSQVTSTLAGNDAPEWALYHVTLTVYTPVRMDTVALCNAMQTAIFEAGFSYPTLTPGSTTLDGARKAQILTFERWDDWQLSIPTA